MSTSKTFVGARAKIFINNILVGLFESVDVSASIGTEPIFTCGKYGAQEIVVTSYEAVSLNCSGLRIIGNGGHVLPKFPKLQDLLNLEGVTLSVSDRQAKAGDPPILVAHNCIPSSYSTGYSAKSTSKIRISYQSTNIEDESGAQSEGDAVQLP